MIAEKKLFRERNMIHLDPFIKTEMRPEGYCFSFIIYYS